MVAIELILKDIGRKLKTDDVRLATAVEIESRTVSSKASNVEMPNELEEEIPTATSTNEQVNISGGGSKKLWNAQEGSTWINMSELMLPTEQYLREELPDALVNKKKSPAGPARR